MSKLTGDKMIGIGLLPDNHRKCGIYAIRRLNTGECYVGQSTDIFNRWRQHRATLRNGTHANSRMQRVFDKYGIAAFAFVPLAVGFDPFDKERLTLAEQEFMDEAKRRGTLYNTAPTAGSPFGFKHSPEAKARMSMSAKNKIISESRKAEISAKLSAALKGKPKSVQHREACRGRIVSEATREKLRAANVGKTMAPAAIEKMRAALLGRTISKEHAKKLNDGWRGRTHSEVSRQKISAALSGRKASAEARANLSIAHIGKVMPEETRAKISAALKGKTRQGKPLSAEHKAKVSLALQGKPKSKEHAANAAAGRALSRLKSAAALTANVPVAPAA